MPGASRPSSAGRTNDRCTPGDRAEVTITMIDDEVAEFFGAGQRFSLWNGTDVGHGTISRRVFNEYGPC